MKINPKHEKVISVYSGFQGIKNILGIAMAIFIGIALISIGIIVSIGMKNFVPLAVLGILGTLFILLAILIWKAAKHQLKGKYYVLAKGWQKPRKQL